MWFKKRDSKGKQRVVDGCFGKSLRNRSLDDNIPPSPSSSPPSSYPHPIAPSIDAHHPDVPHHGHVLKDRRSQFLRLFGHRAVTPKSSSESLASVSTAFSACTPSTTTRRKVKAEPSHSSLSSIASSYVLARTSTSSASSGRKESKESLRKERGKLTRDRGKRETGQPPRKEPFTPDLPPEVWAYILHFAAKPPHPFLASSYLAPSSSLASSSSLPASSSTPTPQGGDPVSFLTYPTSSSSAHLAQAYERMMGVKLALTTVCKLWHAIGQEVLWGFVWVQSAKQAERVLRILDSKALRNTPTESGTSLVETYAYDTRDLGRHIHRLHIEPSSNPTLDFNRCNPETVMKIVGHATGLQVFSDFRGIWRRSKFGVWGPLPSSVVLALTSLSLSSAEDTEGGPDDEAPVVPGMVTPHTYTATSTTSITTSTTSTSIPSRSAASSLSFFDGFDTPPPLSPSSITSASCYDDDDDPLLSALLSPASASSSLKRLSWTSYDHPVPSMSTSLLAVDEDLHDDPEHAEKQRERVYDAGIRYFARVVGPKIEMAAERLEFLELTLCAGDVDGRGGGWLDLMLSSGRSTRGMGGGEAGEMVGKALDLLVLRSLKVTLDNATFHVQSTWSIPALVNLSVISADFSCAGAGFKEFFEAHGVKLRQLELGHSTEAIEDHFLSASHANASDGGSRWRYSGMRVPLAEWCPGLEQFICSAEAEWNWQNPDWIAPHVLLPAHPTLELIGVRDLEKRVREGLDRCTNFDRVQLGREIDAERKGKGHLDGSEGGRSGVGMRGIAGVEVRTRDGREIRVDGDEAFFMLTEQFGSLFNRAAFPALKCVRDLSWESGVMRSKGVEETVRRSGVVASGNGVRGGDVNGRHPMRAARGFLRDILKPSQPLSFPSSSSRILPSPISAVSEREADLQRRLGLQQHRRVLRFWMRVLEKCKERGVYLEDWAGWNVTVGEIRRVAMFGVGEVET